MTKKNLQILAWILVAIATVGFASCEEMNAPSFNNDNFYIEGTGKDTVIQVNTVHDTVTVTIKDQDSIPITPDVECVSFLEGKIGLYGSEDLIYSVDYHCGILTQDEDTVLLQEGADSIKLVGPKYFSFSKENSAKTTVYFASEDDTLGVEVFAPWTLGVKVDENLIAPCEEYCLEVSAGEMSSDTNGVYLPATFEVVYYEGIKGEIRRVVTQEERTIYSPRMKGNNDTVTPTPPTYDTTITIVPKIDEDVIVFKGIWKTTDPNVNNVEVTAYAALKLDLTTSDTVYLNGQNSLELTCGTFSKGRPAEGKKQMWTSQDGQMIVTAQEYEVMCSHIYSSDAESQKANQKVVYYNDYNVSFTEGSIFGDTTITVTLPVEVKPISTSTVGGVVTKSGKRVQSYKVTYEAKLDKYLTATATQPVEVSVKTITSKKIDYSIKGNHIIFEASWRSNDPNAESVELSATANLNLNLRLQDADIVYLNGISSLKFDWLYFSKVENMEMGQHKWTSDDGQMIVTAQEYETTYSHTYVTDAESKTVNQIAGYYNDYKVSFAEGSIFGDTTITVSLPVEVKPLSKGAEGGVVADTASSKAMQSYKATYEAKLESLTATATQPVKVSVDAITFDGDSILAFNRTAMFHGLQEPGVFDCALTKSTSGKYRLHYREVFSNSKSGWTSVSITDTKGKEIVDNIKDEKVLGLAVGQFNGKLFVGTVKRAEGGYEYNSATSSEFDFVLDLQMDIFGQLSSVILNESPKEMSSGSIVKTVSCKKLEYSESKITVTPAEDLTILWP